MSNNAIIMGEFKEFCLWLRRNKKHARRMASRNFRSAYAAFEEIRSMGKAMPNIYRAPFSRAAISHGYTDWKLAKSSKWRLINNELYKEAWIFCLDAPEENFNKWLERTFGDA